MRTRTRGRDTTAGSAPSGYRRQCAGHHALLLIHSNGSRKSTMHVVRCRCPSSIFNLAFLSSSSVGVRWWGAWLGESIAPDRRWIGESHYKRLWRSAGATRSGGTPRSTRSSRTTSSRLSSHRMHEQLNMIVLRTRRCHCCADQSKRIR